MRLLFFNKEGGLFLFFYVEQIHGIYRICQHIPARKLFGLVFRKTRLNKLRYQYYEFDTAYKQCQDLNQVV